MLDSVLAQVADAFNDVEAGLMDGEEHAVCFVHSLVDNYLFSLALRGGDGRFPSADLVFPVGGPREEEARGSGFILVKWLSARRQRWLHTKLRASWARLTCLPSVLRLESP